MNQLMRDVEKKFLSGRTVSFAPGDTVSISMKIREGEKTRIQPFQGVVLQMRGQGVNKTVTIRKASGNVYVERVFPLHSPLVADVKLIRKGQVRRARLYYLRGRTGKSTRIKEAA